MLYVKQSSGISSVTWNKVETASVSFDLQGTAVLKISFDKIGRIACAKFEATGTVTDKTPTINVKIPNGFAPIHDVFSSAFQRTAGNNYETYYSGCVYQLHENGSISFNCADGSALERNANVCYITKE